MSYPNGIFERLDWLTKKYKQLCCLIKGNTAAGCITHKDITWEELNAKNTTATLEDCFYNVINRPNSGTDPLYVLAEGGRVDLDNEVVRTVPAIGSLCLDDNQTGVGCFNIYAQDAQFEVEYGTTETVLKIQANFPECPVNNFLVGDIVTDINTLATGVIIWRQGNSPCYFYVKVTSGSFGEGEMSDGEVNTRYSVLNECNDSTLSVGTEVFGVPALNSDPIPTGIITALSGSNITITPTSGNWDGIIVFYKQIEKNTCYFTFTAPIEVVTTQLNTETVCWDAQSYLGNQVLLSTLIKASDGLIYGTLQSNYSGGDCGYNQPGQLFSLNPINNVVTVLFEFNNSKNTGAYPNGDLVEVAGELYGTCVQGGEDGAGIIWKWNIATKTFTKLHDITPGQGFYPKGGLINIGGILYGSCHEGGDYGNGTIFSYEIATSTFTKLADFDGSLLGANPSGTLVEVNPGELWGGTGAGAVNDQGSIFKYTISSSSLSLVLNLNDVSSTSAGCTGGVHLGSDGNVYFNTDLGGTNNSGTACQLTNVSTSPTLTVLYNFSDGNAEYECPIYIDGYLYGINNAGLDRGYIYKLNVSTQFFSILYEFNLIDGGIPILGKLLNINGELFGMTNNSKEKDSSCGQIFKYKISDDIYTNIHALSSIAQTTGDIASLICAGITNPDYSCTTVGNCIYISGPESNNGYTLVLKTIVTYNFCEYTCNPVPGDLLYSKSTEPFSLVGTIQSVTYDDGGDCGIMTVELANNNFIPSDFNLAINNVPCDGYIGAVTGSSLSYSVVPLSGGEGIVNLPCYYNVPFDVITEYPLSQKLTRKQIEYLVNNSLLIPGTYYRIIDVDFYLYGGTEIVIQAISPNEFNDVAMGKFYTPKYNKLTSGYGIWYNELNYDVGDTAIWGGQVWTNLYGNVSSAYNSFSLDLYNWSISGRLKLKISNITGGAFYVNDLVYGVNSNYKALVVEVGLDYIIVMAPPSFFKFSNSTSPQVTNLSTAAAADIDLIEIAAPFFNDITYNVVWDEIKYDYKNDFISYRKDNSGNIVNQEFEDYINFGAGPFRNILGMQWGNDYNADYNLGVGSNVVTGLGYVDIINFRGGVFTNNTFKDSTFLENEFRPGFSSFMTNNIISNNSQVFLSTFENGVRFIGNTVSNQSIIGYLSLSYTYFNSNNIINSILNFSNTGGLPGNIVNLFANGAYLVENISGASIIYQGYFREIVARTDNVTVIRYINSSNVEIIVPVTT